MHAPGMGKSSREGGVAFWYEATQTSIVRRSVWTENVDRNPVDGSTPSGWLCRVVGGASVKRNFGQQLGRLSRFFHCLCQRLLQQTNLFGSFVVETDAFFRFRVLLVFRQERGMSRQDAEDVIEKMAKYDDFFVNLMMNEELGLQVCSKLIP